MDIKNIKIIVDIGDGDLWTYENICSFITNERLLNENDSSSKIYSMNIDSLNVKIEKKEIPDTLQEISKKLDILINKKDKNQTCRKSKSDN
jgi:hypothetical protein